MISFHKLCNDATKLAIDSRLINQNLYSEGDSQKNGQCLKKIHRIWQEDNEADKIWCIVLYTDTS